MIWLLIFSVGLSPSEEALPPLPTHQYEDYLRECQDIRQSVVISSSDEEKLPISRTDSGGRLNLFLRIA